MKYLSVCSGIEAATVAWHGLGWEPVGFSEIEPFPCQLLAERFPTVPNLGDMTKYREWPIERGTVDLLVGGTPCQAFSVTGLRKGLEDPRGNLALTFVGMVDWYRPEWVVWENVPGVLSSSGGRDFGAFLGALGQLGYGFAYRVLDAQHFGVPQRRRRVFVVAHSSGDPRRAGAVLFEPESLRGDTKARKRTGQDAPAHAGASFEAGLPRTVGALCADTHPGAYSGQDAYTGRLIPASILYENHANDSRVTQEDSTSPTVTSRWGTSGNNTPLVQQAYRKSRRAQSTDDYETWVDDGVANTVNCFDQGDIRTTHAVALQQPISIHPHCIGRSPDSGPQGKEYLLDGSAYCMDSRGQPQAVAVQQAIGFYPTGGTHGVSASSDVSPSVKVGSGTGANPPRVVQPIGLDEEQNARVDGFGCLKARTEGGGFEGAVMTQQMAVRRLTPVECERLQGFPDGWTDIRPKGKDTPDSPRYKALGNSMAVPVMRWIGERIHNAG